MDWASGPEIGLPFLQFSANHYHQLDQNLGIPVTSKVGFPPVVALPSVHSFHGLGGHVAMSVKEKIWAGQYVDFTSLYCDNAFFSMTRADATSSAALELTVQGD